MEFASLASKKARRKELSRDAARDAFRLFRAVGLPVVQTEPRLPIALDISLAFHLSLWDAAYVAVAAEHDCPVLTSDARLFRSGAARHPSRLIG
jgi:predicted nucleic acid-binding protein